MASQHDLAQRETAPTVCFTTVDELFSQVSSLAGDILIVHGVAHEVFSDIERERKTRHQRFRFRQYDSRSKTLVIAVPTPTHELLHTLLDDEALRAFFGMGRGCSWLSLGCTTFSDPYFSDEDCAEADSSTKPRAAGMSWPSLVILAAHTEPLDDLRRDMRWWFTLSEHQVMVVLLAKLEEQRRTITIETWIEPQTPLPWPPGAEKAPVEPVCDQTITITLRDPDADVTAPGVLSDPASYVVTGGDLTLEVARLRRWLSDTGERIVITVETLQSYAATVFSRALAPRRV